MATPDLLGVPNEMIALITQYLSKDDLLHLRLSCKSMEDATRCLAAKRCFTDRVFFIADERSLGVLLEISKHETFSMSMRRISFSCATVTDPSSYRSGIGFRETFEGLRSRRDGRRRFRDFSRTYWRIYAEQRAFEERDGDTQYLNEILINFKTVGNVPALVASNERFGPGPDLSNASSWAHEPYRPGLRYARGLRVACFLPRPHHVLNAAIRDTDFPITHLELGSHHEGIMYDSGMLDHCNQSSYAHLRTIHMRIETRSESYQILGENPIAFKNYYPFFLEVKDLQVLKLSSDFDSLPSIPFEAVVAAATGPPSARSFQKIKVVEVSFFRIDFAQLIRFVEATRETLRRLVLANIEFLGKLPEDPEMKIRDAHGGEDFDITIGDYFQVFRG